MNELAMNKHDYILHSLKQEKLTGFFIGALRMGYNMDDAWELLLCSEEGQGILNNDYMYCVHHQGITSAQKADQKFGYKFKKGKPTEPKMMSISCFADFITNMHIVFKVSYKDFFNKYPIGKFYDEFGDMLGWYDEKLFKAYLL